MAAALIERYGMEPLPVEGAYIAQTWHASARAGRGPAGTAIVGLYCDDPPSRSLFHRLDHDEVWHHYAGDPIRLVLLHADGSDEEVVLGGDVAAGAQVQHVVPAGSWQAGELVPGGAWALFGCTMAPGFTPAGFEGGHAAELRASHPARAGDIDRLAVPGDAGTAMHAS